MTWDRKKFGAIGPDRKPGYLESRECVHVIGKFRVGGIVRLEIKGIEIIGQIMRNLIKLAKDFGEYLENN